MPFLLLCLKLFMIIAKRNKIHFTPCQMWHSRIMKTGKRSNAIQQHENDSTWPKKNEWINMNEGNYEGEKDCVQQDRMNKASTWYLNLCITQIRIIYKNGATKKKRKKKTLTTAAVAPCAVAISASHTST